MFQQFVLITFTLFDLQAVYGDDRSVFNLFHTSFTLQSLPYTNFQHYSCYPQRNIRGYWRYNVFSLSRYLTRLHVSIMARSSSWQAMSLPSLLAIDTSENIMILGRHVMSQDHVFEGPCILLVGVHQNKLPSCQVCWPWALWQRRYNDISLPCDLKGLRDQKII